MLENDYFELNRLTVKIDKLIDRFKRAEDECSRLQQLNDNLIVRLNQNDKRIKELELKIERIKLSEALSGEGEYADAANRKIDELVREIDKCVALLNV